MSAAAPAGLLPTVPEDWDTALAVVAHPDDIEYGAASAVARWTDQGKSVSYLLASRGEAGIDGIEPAVAAPLREAEERAGARVVGVETVEFLDHRDGVIENGVELRREIVRAIRTHRPQVLITGNYDVKMVGGMTNQADHRAVGLATLDAARDAGNRWIFPELIAEEGLEPWGGVRFILVAGNGTPSHGVDVSGDWLQRGIESLRAHAAVHDRSRPRHLRPGAVPELVRGAGRSRAGSRRGGALRRALDRPARTSTLGRRRGLIAD